MKEIKSGRPVVTQEEMAALLGPAGPGATAISLAAPHHAGVLVDIWFRHRMRFLSVLLLAFSIKLIYFPAGALSHYDDQLVSADYLLRYANYRVVFIWLFAALYTFSYLKDWHFQKLSWAFFGTSLMALIIDLVSVYPYAGDALGLWLAALIALRLTTLYFMLLNALNAHRVPAMPRRPWS